MKVVVAMTLTVFVDGFSVNQFSHLVFIALLPIVVPNCGISCFLVFFDLFPSTLTHTLYHLNDYEDESSVGWEEWTCDSSCFVKIMYSCDVFFNPALSCFSVIEIIVFHETDPSQIILFYHTIINV